MASVKEDNSLSPYRKLLVDLSFDLSKKDVETLKLASVDIIPRRITENIATGLHLFDVLEQDGRIGPRNLDLLQDMLETVGRLDLARKIQDFLTTSLNGSTESTYPDGGLNGAENGSLTNHSAKNGNSSVNDTEGPFTCDHKEWQNDSVPDGIEDDPSLKPQAPEKESESSLYNSDPTGGHKVAFRRCGEGAAAPQTGVYLAAVHGTSSDGNIGSLNVSGPSAPGSSGPQARQQRAGTLGGSSSRIKPVGPKPTRYVNFLAWQGYVVEILGGKHFKTPEGEFVEMKSGTQYKIHVKNTHTYGCNLDVSIDGYDVGGWVVDGGQEFTIERPAYEAKKFTFYRAKTAPKEAGIEPGRAENGIVKCVFTPEAFLNIPVFISGLPHPLDVTMPPSATVGELKREIQHQLKVTEDADQVLCSDDKVFLNSDSVRDLPTRNLRFINNELKITIETSTSETNFSVEVHPGRAKVCDVMKQIERKLNVPIRDQKLYHGRTRLSDAPRRDLPYGLICSPQPTLVVIVPEYIQITVEEENGDIHTIKMDKEKSLAALMKEIPSCSSLQENEEAILCFKGRQICPARDEGTLTSLGLCSGSKLELKVNIIFISVQVCFPNGSPATKVRCSPHETFKDLVKKLEMEGKKRKLGKVIFAMEERVFDPDQDKAPLQEYGITHGSILEMRGNRAKSNESGGEDDVNKDEDDDVSMREKESASIDRVAEMQESSRWFSEKLGGLGNEDNEVLGASSRLGASSLIRRWSSKSANVRLEELGIRLGNEDDDVFYANSRLGGSIPDPSFHQSANARVVEPDPAWRAGGTTLQGYSTQQFVTAEPIKVDPSRKVELVLRLVAREDEDDLAFPKDECKPLSTLCPPPVPE